VHPVAIGAFAAGAVALVIAAVFIFGANKVFARKFPIIMFFDENVNGLTVGAPISYRGLRLGQVTEIRSPVGSPRIAVLATLERGPLITPRSAETVSAHQMRQTLEEAVSQGLRAQLSLQSFLTGQLYVSLVLRPDTPASTVGIGGSTLEIPTIPTIMAQLEAGLQKIPLAELPKHMSDTLAGTARMLNDPDLAKTLQAVGPVLADAQKLVRRLEADAGPLLASVKATSDTARISLVEVTRQLDRVVATAQPLLTSLTATSDTARGAVTDVSVDVKKTLGDLQKTLAELGPQLTTLAVRLEAASEAARVTLEGAQETLRTVDGALTGELPLGHQLKQTLQDLAAAARSLRALADALERNPEALLMGKPGATQEAP
jgi:paraquat-inducible protein B